MTNFEIISDSGFDMNHELRQRFGVCDDYVRGNIVFPDGHSEPADCDWKNIRPDEYFSMMADKKKMFHTSTRSIEEMTAVLEKHLKLGSDILVISLSSGLSGTYRLFVTCQQELLKKYPKRKIIVIDSLRYSTSLALLCIYAGKLKQEGKSIEETAKWIEEHKNCIHQMGPLDDLFFLKRAGRISFAKAFFGSMVGVKPLGDFNEKGTSSVLGKAKGQNNAFRASIEYIKHTIVEPEKQIIMIAHSYREEAAKKFMEMIKENIKCKGVILTVVGESCGANIGPGLIAAFYLGYTISKDNVDEKKVLEEVLETL